MRNISYQHRPVINADAARRKFLSMPMSDSVSYGRRHRRIVIISHIIRIRIEDYLSDDDPRLMRSYA